MKLQQDNQRRCLRWLAGLLLVANSFPGQTHAVSFSKATATVAPSNNFVAFAKENPEITALMTVAVAGALVYVIYQFFAPKSPISHLVVENQQHAQDDLHRQRVAFQVSQPHVKVVHEAYLKTTAESLGKTRKEAVENIFAEFANNFNFGNLFDEPQEKNQEDPAINCMLRIMERLRTFEVEVRGKSDVEIRRFVQSAFKDIFNIFPKRTEKNDGLTEDDKEKCAFLTNALQEYAGFCKQLDEARKKNEVEFQAHVKANAEANPKESASAAWSDMRAEEQKKAIAKAKEKHAPATMSQDVMHEFVASYDWNNLSVADIFAKNQAQLKTLQELYPSNLEKNQAHFVEESVRGKEGILALVASAVAHKMCEIVCGKDKKINKRAYEYLCGRLFKASAEAYQSTSYNITNPLVRNSICEAFIVDLGPLSPDKERQIDVTLDQYQQFVRATRAEMDVYLKTCGYSASADGDALTSGSSSFSYAGSAAPVMSSPYVQGYSAKPSVRPLRIDLGSPTEENADTQEETTESVPVVSSVRSPEVPRSIFVNRSSGGSSSSLPSESSSSYGSSTSMPKELDKKTVPVARPLPQVLAKAAKPVAPANQKSAQSQKVEQAQKKAQASAAVQGESQKQQQNKLTEDLKKAVDAFCAKRSKHNQAEKQKTRATKAIENAALALIKNTEGLPAQLCEKKANAIKQDLDNVLRSCATQKSIDKKELFKKLQAFINTWISELQKKAASLRS